MSETDLMERPARQRRPGGRTADVTRRIHEAVLELLVEGGIDACTFQNVASRAGVERSTLYRRNPDRWPLIIDAIIDFAERAQRRRMTTMESTFLDENPGASPRAWRGCAGDAARVFGIRTGGSDAGCRPLA